MDGGDRAFGALGLWLSRDPPADSRAHGSLRALARGRHGHRREGDVHLPGPQRRQPELATGGDRRLCPGRARARASVQPDPEALVRGSYVSPRAAAEGPLSAVPPDRGRGLRHGRTRYRCGDHRPDGAAVAGARPRRAAARGQLARQRAGTDRLSGGAAGLFRSLRIEPGRRQPPAPRSQPAPDPR